MTWWGWILIAAYVIVCVVWYRRLVWFFAVGEDVQHPKEIDGESLFFGLVMGLFIAPIWPLAMLVWGCLSLYRRYPASFHGVLLAPPRNARTARDLDVREWKLRRAEERLSTLADSYARGEIDIAQLEDHAGDIVNQYQP